MVNSSARAIAASIRVSPRKLGVVASLIRNMKVSEAMIQLDFCKRRAAHDVKKCLRSAIANAENNFGLDIDRLYVDHISVGKALVMKRVTPRARGRSAKIEKFFSRLYIVVSERKGK